MVPPNLMSVAVLVASGACRLTNAPPAMPMMITSMIQEAMDSHASQTKDMMVINKAETRVTL